MRLFTYPKNSKWEGIDVSLGISLEEYGMIARPTEKEGEYFVIYNTHQGYFDKAWIDKKYLIDLLKGKEWANEEDIKSFKSYIGVTDYLEDYYGDNFTLMLFDVCQYWGVDNVIGSSYYKIDNEAVQKWINNEME